MTQSEVDQLKRQMDGCDKKRNYAQWCQLRQQYLNAQAQLYQEQRQFKPRVSVARDRLSDVQTSDV